MERFLHHRLEELHSQTDMKNLIDNLPQRIAAHQSRAHQTIYSEPMENIEVLLRVILGVAVDQSVESNFFPGILEGLLGWLGIAAHGKKNPPTSTKEGAARLWASAVLNAVQKMEKRQVRLETSGFSGMPSGGGFPQLSKSPSAWTLHRPFVPTQHGQLSVQTSHTSSIVWGPAFRSCSRPSHHFPRIRGSQG